MNMETHTKKQIAIEILPRALWVVMAICLYMEQHFTDRPSLMIDNILLISLGVVLSIGFFLSWMYVGYYMRRALFDKSLVTTGPFEYIRHPMYIGIYTMLFGVGIVFFSKIWFMIMLVFIPVWYFNCKIEEKQMTEFHGEKYLNYKKRTGMFFPKIFYKREYGGAHSTELAEK